MASFEKRAGGWRVKIRKSGQTHTATFTTKAAAQDWATKTEAGIIAGRLGMVPDKTFADLVERYIKEVTPAKRGGRQEEYRLRRTMDDTLGQVKLTALCPNDFAGWRDRRLTAVSPASVLREWGTLANACNIAVDQWRWLNENPMRKVKRPGGTPPRQRTISQDEIDRILFVCGNDYATAMGRVGLAFEFAVETAMRAGEIVGLTWDNVFDRHVHLPRTKNGMPRDVPLSDKAKGVLARLDAKLGDQCFGLTAGTLDALFRRARDKAGVEGFTFHDSRRTALTRLAKIFPNVLDLARISGHRDIRLLSQVYYAPSVEDLADRLQSRSHLASANASSAAHQPTGVGTHPDAPDDQTHGAD